MTGDPALVRAFDESRDDRHDRAGDDGAGDPTIHDAVIASSLDAIIVTDANRVVTLWSPGAEILYGIPATDALGRRAADLLDTFDGAGTLLDRDAARAELSASGSWRRRIVQRPRLGPRTAEEIVVDSVASVVPGRNGNGDAALAVNRDVTASARLESEMAALASLAVATDRARTKAEVAQAALEILCRATGADAGLVTSMESSYEATAHIGVAQPTIDVILSLGELGGPIVQALQAPDAYISADVATAPLREDVRSAVLADGIDHLVVVGLHLAGRLTGILALGWRTRRPHEPRRAILHQAAALIAASIENAQLLEGVIAGERRYRALFESSPDAVLLQSVGEEVVVDANPAAIRLYGDGLIGTPVAALFEEDADAPTHDVADHHGFSRYTGTGRRIDGTTFPEEVDLRPIEIGGEERMLAIVRDVTDRRRLEGELVQAQKMEAIGHLVAGVAHELNNPLASIVAFSQLIRTDPNLPVDIRGQADMLVQEANRTRVIVQNLLDFARQRPPERMETELRPLIDSVLGLQAYVLARNQVSVEIDVPDDLPTLAVDRSQLQQVLINLTFNSAQALRDAGRPGRLRVAARVVETDGGRIVRIEVADNGPGVDEAIVDRLFVPFVTTKEPGEGTGLGLSVSFGIVAGHGGTLRYAPISGGGASFVIDLPIERDAAPTARPADHAPEAAAAPSGQLPSSAAAAPSGQLPSSAAAAPSGQLPSSAAAAPSDEPAAAPDGPIRVLVLDDESSIRDFLGRVLIRSGYEPVLVASGSAALEIVRSDPPAAILCDHRMAGMSGTEFLAAVAEVAPELTRHFAFMSGDVLNPELRQFAESRGVQLLAKPFDIATVAALVGRLVV